MGTQIIRTSARRGHAAVALSACQTPQAIQNIDGAQVTPSTAKSVSGHPGSRRHHHGRHLARLEGGRCRPRQARGHAQPALPHRRRRDPVNSGSYSIKHKRTEGLNESGGMIHRNYNSWVSQPRQGDPHRDRGCSRGTCAIATESRAVCGLR
jgi:hypothetical protein